MDDIAGTRKRNSRRHLGKVLGKQQQQIEKSQEALQEEIEENNQQRKKKPSMRDGGTRVNPGKETRPGSEDNDEKETSNQVGENNEKETEPGNNPGETSRRPSVRRNRDYSKSITWKYELNIDIHYCFLEADKSTPGYMARLKILWDKKHPELSHLTERQLREQANRVAKKGLVMEAKHRDNETDGNKTENENKGMDVLTSITAEEEENQALENERLKPEKEEVYTPEAIEIANQIRNEWKDFYTNYLKIGIENREYLTKKDRNIEEQEIQASNIIMEEQIIEEGDNISLRKINDMHYVTAIILLKRHGKLRTRTTTRKERKTPIWITNIQNKISAIRRKISHLHVVLQCKKEQKFSQKQNKIRDKIKGTCGNCKRRTVEEVLTKLKT